MGNQWKPASLMHQPRMLVMGMAPSKSMLDSGEGVKDALLREAG